MNKKNKAIIGSPIFALFFALVALTIAACSGKPGNTPGNSTPPKNAANNPNAPAGAAPPNMLGSPTAAVTLEEFADFQCPSCGDKHPVMKQIQSMYGSRIKFIFRNFPLPMHDKAYDAAVAAEAAGIQNRFWEMHNQLYTNQKTWSSDPNYKQVFADYAQKIGLDVDKFKDDMIGLQTKSRVQADIDRGRALSIGSTPTLFINGEAVPYPEMTVDSLRQLIDAKLQAAAASNKPAPPAPGKESSSNTNQK